MGIVFDPSKNNVYQQVEQNENDIADLRAIVDGIDVQSSWITPEAFTTEQAYYTLSKITGALQDVKVGEHVYFVSNEIDAIITWIGNDQYQVGSATSRKGTKGDAGDNLVIGYKALVAGQIWVDNQNFTISKSNIANPDDIKVGAPIQVTVKRPQTNAPTTISMAISTIVSFTDTIVTCAAADLYDLITDGAAGRGIVSFENTGTSQGEGFTITHCEATMTTGQPESFDIQAENGKAAFSYNEIYPLQGGIEVNKQVTLTALRASRVPATNEFIIFNGVTGDGTTYLIQAQVTGVTGNNIYATVKSFYQTKGAQGAAGATPFITISDVPSTATQGYLTADQMTTLNASPNDAYIMFYGEKFIPMDITNGDGYRVYTHHGETADKQEVSKLIYLNTTATGGQGYFWVMNVNAVKKYYNVYLNAMANALNFQFYFVSSVKFNTLSELMTYLNSKENKTIWGSSIALLNGVKCSGIRVSAANLLQANVCDSPNSAGQWYVIDSNETHSFYCTEI